MEGKINDIASESRQLSSTIARLGNSPGPAPIHQELQSLIKDSLHSLTKNIEYVRTFVEDEEDAKIRDDQRITVLKYAEDLENHRILYRKSLLKAKRNLETSHATTRNLLFDGRASSKNPSSRRDESTSNAVLQASSDVTSELRRTHELMATELSKSAFSQELLHQSSQTLSSLHEEYTAFQTILAGSKRLLKELENADRADKLWIWASLSFFLTVVAWILYRRILSKGIHLMVWIFGGLFKSSISSSSSSGKAVKQVVTPAVSIATSVVMSIAANAAASSSAATSTTLSNVESIKLELMPGGSIEVNPILVEEIADEGLTIDNKESSLLKNAMVNEAEVESNVPEMILGNEEDGNIHDEL